MGLILSRDPWVIRPFGVSEVTTRRFFPLLDLEGSLPSAGPIVYLII